jgi:hypothetical protein
LSPFRYDFCEDGTEHSEPGNSEWNVRTNEIVSKFWRHEVNFYVYLTDGGSYAVLFVYWRILHRRSCILLRRSAAERVCVT